MYKDEYKKTHLDTEFLDHDNFPVHEQNEHEIERPVALVNQSRLYNFVHSTALQHIRFNNTNNNDEVSSTSSDSDDATVVEPYVPPDRNRSDTEDGEINEDSVPSDDDSSKNYDLEDLLNWILTLKK